MYDKEEPQNTQAINKADRIPSTTPARERTAREALQNSAEQATRYAATLYEKVHTLDREFGRSLLDQPESSFRKKFSLDFWEPF